MPSPYRERPDVPSRVDEMMPYSVSTLEEIMDALCDVARECRQRPDYLTIPPREFEELIRETSRLALKAIVPIGGELRVLGPMGDLLVVVGESGSWKWGYNA